MPDNGSGETVDPPQVSVINKINFKVPPFEKSHVDVWFFQLEAQFAIHNITSEKTKYNYTLPALDTSVAAELTDVLEKAATSATPYEDLKKRLVSIYADSQEKKLKKLLTEVELGDRRPTALLREMQRLAGSKAPEDLMKSMFLQHMPSNVRAILATSKDDVQTVAEMADKIIEQTGSQATIAEVRRNPSDSLEDRIRNLESQIANLVTEMQRGRARQRSPTPYRSRSKSRSRHRNNEWCWYHNRFGKNATKCQEPCKFSPENSTPRQ